METKTDSRDMPKGLVAGVTQALSVVAGVALLAMVALTVGNIVLRVFATPYYGTSEIIALLAVVVNGLALAEAQREKSHITVDLLMSRVSVRAQLIVGAAVTVLSVVLFSLLSQQLVGYGLNLQEEGALTDSLQLPYWPFPLVLAVGAAGLALALIGDVFAIVRNLRSAHPEGIW